MSSIKHTEDASISGTRSRPRSTSQGQQEGERTPRPSVQREVSNTSSHHDERFPRFHLPGLARNTSDQEATRLLARDFADQDSSRQLRHVRSTTISFRQPSIRRRFGSVRQSQSPAPSHSWRHFMDSDRRSVAFAASGRDHDTVSRRFSLAGPPPIDTMVANHPYVDPGYAQLNPAYDQPVNVRPVWGLAKPLPHVLRPGMVPTKDELESGVMQKEDQAESVADLESGRIEPSLRPSRTAAQLDEIRRERELSLFETFQRQRLDSPGFSPMGYPRKAYTAPTDIPDIQSHLGEPIIEEDEEYQHHPSDPELAGLDEAISNANRAKELENAFKLPYEDVIPLSGYEAEDDEVHNLHTYWSVIRLRFREPLAELLGITVQYTLGFSANLALTVSRGAAGVGDTGDWAWGLATMIAIYVAGGISGAHLNPAISIMLYVYRGFPLSKIPSYITAQMVGAFLATLITFAIFRPGLIALQARDLAVQGQHPVIFEPSAMPHASVVLVNYLTFPRQPWVGTGTAFLTELVGTTILAVAVLALGDDTNAPPGAGMNAFIVGLLVAVLGMAFGFNTGLAMNPARDFGPRVALTVLGYSTNPHPSLFADMYWIRVNWLAPICGTILGGFLYDSMIFIGGESPVNYPVKRIKRAARKWKGRWQARFGRTKQMLHGMKDEVMGS